jgi:tetratricopeptide (TPR) repeat protein
MGGGKLRRRRIAVRRWVLTPTLRHAPGEAFEGAGLLSEVPGALGLLLWRTARDVALWGDSPPAERSSLFAAESIDKRIEFLATSCPVPPEVSAPVHSLLLSLSLTSQTDSGELTICCLEVAAWARTAGLPQTAIAFAQAGAIASPADSDAALHTGLYALAAGQAARAETWLRHAVGLARQERNGVAYCDALVELGAVAEARGETDKARRDYTNAFRAARRTGARRARMRSAYALFQMGRASGWSGRQSFAEAAQTAYESGVPGGVEMLLGLARYWAAGGRLDAARDALGRIRGSDEALPSTTQLQVAAFAARVYGACQMPGNAVAEAAVAWARMSDEEVPDPVRLDAARELVRAAVLTGDPAAFTRAKRAVLRLVAPAEYPGAVAHLAAIWPDGAACPTPVMERAP